MSLVFFIFTFLPYVIIGSINNGIGRLFKINKITNNIFAALAAILTWTIAFYVSLIILAFISDILRLSVIDPSLLAVISANACTYYIVFVSILISNKLAKVVFFKINKIDDIYEKKLVNNQINIFWNYSVFLLSFIAKPLNFSNPDVKLFFDALFYASATLSLLSKANESKNKSE